MTRRAFIILLLCAVGFLNGIASMAEISDEGLVTMRPPELKKLDPLVGNWDGEATIYSTPSSTKSTARMKASFRWILRTYHLEGTLSYAQQGRSFEGRVLITYDWNRKAYIAYWIDDFSSLPVLYTGSFREGSLVVNGSLYQQPRPSKQRLRLKLLSNDEWELTGGSDFTGEMIDSFALRAHRTN